MHEIATSRLDDLAEDVNFDEGSRSDYQRSKCGCYLKLLAHLIVLLAGSYTKKDRRSNFESLSYRMNR